MDTKKAARLADTIEWASLVVVAAAIAAYFITSSAVAPLFFLVPAIAMRAVVLRMKTEADNVWFLIGTIAVTILTVIAALGN